VAVTRFFRQGWREYRASIGTDVLAFGILEETLLTLHQRGNHNALFNRLEIGKGDQGIGDLPPGHATALLRRERPADPRSSRREADSEYRASEPRQFPSNCRPATGVCNRSSTRSARPCSTRPRTSTTRPKGYVDNWDLLWPAVRTGWDGWAEVAKQLKDPTQATVLIVSRSLLPHRSRTTGSLTCSPRSPACLTS
jgi:hypothetical protein